MTRAVTLAAPAKVNLYLEVTGRRADGYHTLETVFLKTGLADSVAVRRIPDDRVELDLVDTARTGAPAGPDNLAVRAAEAYRRRFRIKAGVGIRLVKRIPAAGGLGGGSSDAGAVLRAMARLFPGPGREKALPALAKSLGADVPVFLSREPLLVGKGIGDRLKPIKAGKHLPGLLIAHPGVAVPTADAYRKLGFSRRKTALTGPSRLGKLVRFLTAGAPAVLWTRLLFNRLEEAVLPSYPAVAEVKRMLASMGAAPLMSGSGSCVFAFIPSRAEGRRWAARLRRAGASAWLVRSLS